MKSNGPKLVFWLILLLSTVVLVVMVVAGRLDLIYLPAIPLVVSAGFLWLGRPGRNVG